MVFPNGGKTTFYKDSYDGKLPIETLFIKELIPYIDNDAFLLLEKNLEQIKKMRILIDCGTKDDGHIGTIREFHQALLDHGVDHTYWEMEDLAHERKRFIEILSPILYDYHVESLRLAGTLK